MIKYLLFLIIGICAGYIFNGKYTDKLQKISLNVSILLLLFFMGTSIGKDPLLTTKLSTFGIQALVISGFSIFFSILAVLLIIKIIDNKE